MEFAVRIGKHKTRSKKVKHSNILTAILLIVILVLPITNVHAQTNTPVVHAVLFYSPTCGHCEYVINGTLLPMVEKYGEQLQIIGIDVTQQQGQVYFTSAMKKFNLESAGVPFLVIDNMYLVGSADIPEKFPGLVETYLAQGGVDWPDIPELREAILRSSEDGTATAAVTTPETIDSTATIPAPSATIQTTSEPVTVSPAAPTPTALPGIVGIHTETSYWLETFARDPAGNTLSVLVLIGMLGSIVWAVATNNISLDQRWKWIIPLLCVIGFAVAGYLAYVEVTDTTAVCGPVGDCNTVQQSEYARLFGILPIGVMGLVGYLAIFISWLVTRWTNGRLADFAAFSLFVMTAGGTLFSIYLTFLEPFVIGATCAWCITSAIIMTILFLLTFKNGKQAFRRLTSL